MLGPLGGVLGAGRDCRYSGARIGIGSIRGIRGLVGVQGVLGPLGCQGCMGGLAGSVGTHRSEGV